MNPVDLKIPKTGKQSSTRGAIFRLRLILFVVAVNFIGCAPNDRQVKFYLLQPTSPSAVRGLTEAQGSGVVGLGPVEIPAYLDRPQMVTGNPGAELQLAEYHRWAEPLKDTITRVLTENLGLWLPARHVIAFPWNRAITPDFQVEVKINRFQVGSDGACELKADWTILRQNKPVMMDTFQTSTAAVGSDFAAKVAAQSQALARLSQALAVALQELGDFRK